MKQIIFSLIILLVVFSNSAFAQKSESLNLLLHNQEKLSKSKRQNNHQDTAEVDTVRNNLEDSSLTISEEDLVIPKDYIINFARTTEGQTYTGTIKGIKMWDGSSNIIITTENSNIPDDNITALAVDQHDHLWIGCNNAGIVVGTGDPIKPYKTHSIKTHQQKIFSIVPDTKGNVWVIYQDGSSECFRDEISRGYFPNE